MTTAQGAEVWIDYLCNLWNFDRGDGVLVRSYKQADIPGAILPEHIPCAVSYIIDCRPVYSAGGPNELHWEGHTDFHLTKDVKPANVSLITPYYRRILAAATAHIKLGGLVNNFEIPDERQAMMFVSYAKPGSVEDDHQGIRVRWYVKQKVSGYTIGV